MRDTCRLRPGVPEISENIRVLSIVGRFLEHARVFYFHNGGAEEYYIGSADLMTRNLERRVEILIPIEPPELRAELRRMLDVQLADRRSAWDMQSDGSYVQRTPKSHDVRKNCQELLIRSTQDGYEKALEKKKGKKGKKAKKGVRAPRKARVKKVTRSLRPSAPPAEPKRELN